jgi:glucose/arabinose dehydrogenase
MTRGVERRSAVAAALLLAALAVAAPAASVSGREPTEPRFLSESSAGGPNTTQSLTLAPNAVTVTGFSDTVVLSGLDNPTAVRFASDGRIFVAEKSGLIKVFSSITATTPTVFADLSTRVHNFWDRGLLGMTLDPNFPTQPYVYVLYAYDHILGSTATGPRWGTAGVIDDPCPTPPGPTTDGCTVSGRLSRLTAAGNVMTGTEQVLIEDWCQQYPSHSIGSLEFGPDGALYASGGDGASFDFADYGQAGGTLPNTTNPITPKNVCGDPPVPVGGTQVASTGEGGALRSQDLRTRGSTGSGPVDSYLSTVLADAPAVYYRLNEASGTAAADASPNGRTGTYSGTLTLGATGLLTGDPSKAVTLTNGQVDVPSSVNPWSGDFTLEAWVKPNQVATWGAIFSRETYNVNGIRFGQQGGRFAVWTSESGGSMEIGGGNVVAGTTYHVVATRAGSTYRLYVNGNEVATGTGTMVAPAAGGRFGSTGGAPFKGVLDEAAMYTTALSAARVAAHYAAGIGGVAPTAPDPVTLDGAILRLDPATGAARAGNPLAGDPDPNAARIIAEGLRNPFRFTFRPGTNELWIGDVGWGVWEEIERLVSPTAAVANFGWPCYEGAGTLPSYGGVGICQNLIGSGGVTGPYYTYDHDVKVVAGESCPTGSSSITGITFYQGGNYPSAYANALFFTDHSRNCIWAMKAGANGLPSTSNIETFVAAAGNPVDLKIGPGGDLFYVDLEGGAIHRIKYASGNAAPTASFTATPNSGQAPLTVQFNAGASSDPENGTLAYSWDLDGNGTYGDATGVTTSRTYTAVGTVTVGLRVTDPGNATGTTTRTVTVGNDPPVPVIDNPTTLTTWKVGDTVTFSGHATDAQDGTLAASRLSWTLVLNHCPSNCHPHDQGTFPGVASGTFVAPDHEYPSSLELKLTATDSSGASATTSVVIQPQTVDLQFASSPSGAQVTIGGFTGTAPFTRTVILGSINSITTASPQTIGGTSYTFGSWSDNGAQTHNVTAPAGGAAYTATFSAAPPPTGYRATVLADSPLAYYRLNEASGATATDSSPNGRNGTYAGTLTRGTTGLLVNDADKAITLSNGRVDLPTAVNPWNGNFTIEAWVKPSQVSAWAAILSRETYQATGFRLGQQGNRWGFWTTQSGGTVQVLGGTVVSGQTYHIAVTRSGTTYRLYVNGVELANGTGTLVAPTGGGSWGTVGGAPFKGVLDDVAVYGTTLSAARIAAHYAAGRGT